MPAYPGLIVNDNYWRWPERNLAGNVIDFLRRLLGRSFHDASVGSRRVIRPRKDRVESQWAEKETYLLGL